MKTHPQLFNAAMVRAILREIEQPGTGKTQTRRLLYKRGKLTNGGAFDCRYPPRGPAYDEPEFNTQWNLKKRPSVGDLLWVRETFCPVDDREFGGDLWVDYRATPRYEAEHPAGWDADPADAAALKWTPSIHMPRWASRLTLEVTDVRVERVQDISEDDAVAEGATSRRGACPWPDWSMDWSRIGELSRVTRRPLDQAKIALGRADWAFASYWNSIYGNSPDSWENNPWVAVTTFRPHLCNVDDLLKLRNES